MEEFEFENEADNDSKERLAFKSHIIERKRLFRVF